MGNCLMRSNNKVSAQDHEKHDCDKEVEAIQCKVTPVFPKKKKAVRFNLEGDDSNNGRKINASAGDNSKSGVVRIRLVVTQEELRQLLDYKKDSINSDDSSMEQLLSSLKSRAAMTDAAEQSVPSNSDESWRPALESIPEDQC